MERHSLSPAQTEGTSNRELIQMDAVDAPRASIQLSRNTWLLIVAVLLLNSIMRGIRTPTRFAATQLLFNYDFGFCKRALLGGILSTFNFSFQYRYGFFFWFSLTIFAADMLLVFELMKRLTDTGRITARLPALAFASSVAIVVLAHCNGYFEQITLLVTLLVVRSSNFYVRSALVAALFSACILIHEPGYLMLFPAICFRFAPDLADRSDHRMLIIIFLIVLISALTLFVGQAHLSEASAAAMYNAAQAKADYPLFKEAFLATRLTISDNLRLMLLVIWPDPEMQFLFLYSSVVTLPTTLYLLWRSLVTLSGSGHGKAVRWLAILASLAPLSLHLLGADFHRWDALATTSSFLVFSIATLCFEPSSNVPRGGPCHSTILVPTVLIAINLGSSIPLFEGYVVQDFPFEAHVTELMQIMKGQSPFPPRPILSRPPPCVEVAREREIVGSTFLTCQP